MKGHATAEDLSAYVDRELEPVRLRLVESHLAGCEECRSKAGELRRLVGDLRHLERLAPPPALGQRLHRRISLEPRRRPLLERLESRLDGLVLQSSVGFTFAVVFAFAAILYLFVGSVDRHERMKIPVVRPDFPPSTGTLPGEAPQLEVAGLTLRLDGEVWRDAALPPGVEPQELPAGGDAAAEVLDELPQLAPLLAEGRAVELLHDGRALRLLP